MLHADGVGLPASSPLEYLETLDAKPGACRRAGLECETCVEQSARAVAALCRTLTENQQKDSFRRVYRDPCCQLMVPRFLQAYREETDRQPGPLLELVPA